MPRSGVARTCLLSAAGRQPFAVRWASRLLASRAQTVAIPSKRRLSLGLLAVRADNSLAEKFLHKEPFTSRGLQTRQGRCNTPLTLRTFREQCSYYVLSGSMVMVRMVVEEAAALASVALFVATIAVWVQVLGLI